MSQLHDQAVEALLSENPAGSLETLVRELRAGHVPREDIATELGAVVQTLRNDAAGETTAEAVVLEMLDRLWGWCAPDQRL